ncbi:MAG: phage/plasmid replication protein [Clostridia bacterium]
MKNLKIRIYKNSLTLSGSLSEWYFGNNVETFTYFTFLDAIKRLEDTFQISLEKAVITRLDMAGNFSMTYSPRVYQDNLLSLKGFQKGYMEKDTLYFFSNSRKLCFYDKTKEMRVKYPDYPVEEGNLLRYEIRFVKFKKDERLTIGEFCHKKRYRQYVRLWCDSYRKIAKRPKKAVKPGVNYEYVKTPKNFKEIAAAYYIAGHGLEQMIREVDDARMNATLTSMQASRIKKCYEDSASYTGTGKIDYTSTITELNRKVEYVYQEQVNALKTTRKIC